MRSRVNSNSFALLEKCKRLRRGFVGYHSLILHIHDILIFENWNFPYEKLIVRFRFDVIFINFFYYSIIVQFYSFSILIFFFFFISTKGYLYFSIKRPFSLFVRLFGFNIGVRIILQKKKKTIDDRRRGQKYCQKSWLDFWTIGKKWQSFFFFKKKLFGTKENKIFQCYIFQLVNFVSTRWSVQTNLFFHGSYSKEQGDKLL